MSPQITCFIIVIVSFYLSGVHFLTTVKLSSIICRDEATLYVSICLSVRCVGPLVGPSRFRFSLKLELTRVNSS